MKLFTFVNIVCTDGKIIDIYENDRFSNDYIPNDVEIISIHMLSEKDFCTNTICLPQFSKFGIEIFINVIAKNANEAREKELTILRDNKENFVSIMKAIEKVVEMQ